MSDALELDGPNPWSTQSRRVIYDNGRLRLCEDAVIQPDGEPGTYTYIDAPWPIVAIVPISAAGEVYLVDAPTAVDSRAAVGDETADVDNRDLLWRAMVGLTDRQRTALVLRFFHDIADDEVAEMLDCQAGTVRSLISRGLAVLRETGTFVDDEIGSNYLRDAR